MIQTRFVTVDHMLVFRRYVVILECVYLIRNITPIPLVLTPGVCLPVLQQWRLFPFLAGTYVWYEMSVWINEAFADFVRRRISDDDGPELVTHETHLVGVFFVVK